MATKKKVLLEQETPFRKHRPLRTVPFLPLAPRLMRRRRRQ